MQQTIIGKIVLPNKILQGSLTIENGKIANIQEGFPSNREHVLDYSNDGLYIRPGAIEVHGHMREPGLEYKEDISTGTQAAIAGGYTTVFDMPNVKPPTTTVALVEDKIKRYQEKSYTDFAINMGAAKDDIGEFEKIDPSIINGVKIFTAGHATTPTTIPDLGDIARIFRILNKRNIMALLHAENQQLINYFNDYYQNILHRTDPAVYSEVRNMSVVLTSALEMIVLAKQFGVKLYLLHLSTPEEFKAVKFGREIGVDVYGEAVTYQLAFNTDYYEKFGNFISVAPALRSPEDQKKVWEMVKNEEVDTIVSEHTPHSWEEKQEKDVWKSTQGMPDIQESLAVLLTKWVEHFGPETLEEGIMKLSQLTATNIANIFSYSQKGSLEVGKDADITVIDTTSKWRIAKEDLYTKGKWSAYEYESLGQEFIGRPIATFLRGNLVYEKGNITVQPQGKRITRS